MNIQMGCREDIAHRVLSHVDLLYGSFVYDIMDEDIVIDLTICGDEEDKL